jgi:hypothetical protein
MSHDKPPIVDDGYVGLGLGKYRRVKYLKNFHLDVSPIVDPRCTFDIEIFSKELIRENLVKLIVDYRSLILFGVGWVGYVVRTIS